MQDFSLGMEHRGLGRYLGPIWTPNIKWTRNLGVLQFTIKINQIWSNYSDLTRPGPLKGSVLEGKSLISGKSRLVKYSDLARPNVGKYTSHMDPSWVGFHPRTATIGDFLEPMPSWVGSAPWQKPRICDVISCHPRHPGTIPPEVFPVFDRYVFGVQITEPQEVALDV